MVKQVGYDNLYSTIIDEVTKIHVFSNSTISVLQYTSTEINNSSN